MYIKCEVMSELTLVRLLVYFSTNWCVNLAASLPQVLRAAFSEHSVSSEMELQEYKEVYKVDIYIHDAYMYVYVIYIYNV